MSDHERWTDTAAAFVLGALPDDERRAFTDHLAGCERCRAEVDALLPAAEALPMASPQMAPPPALKGRIMAEVEREAELLARAGPEADRPPARRSRAWLSGWRLAPVAAALLIAGVLAGVAIDRAGGDATTYAATIDGARAPGASGELRVEDGEAMLRLADLPQPPSGRVYQVWVMREGGDAPEPTDALFLPRGDGSAAAMVPGGVAGVSAVLVTDEPEGGSEAPTREPLVTAPMS